MDTQQPEFGAIYRRLTQRFMPAERPRPVSPHVLAIGQVVLAVQRLQDSLQRLAGVFVTDARAPRAWAGPLRAAPLEVLLERLRPLADRAGAPWQSDLQVLLAHADAAREVLDWVLFARVPAPHAPALLGLHERIASADQIAQFADAVARLDAAFCALGAQHVLDCHQRGVTPGNLPRAPMRPAKPRTRRREGVGV